MTIEQCEKRNDAIMQDFKRWQNGEIIRLTYFDICIICEELSIDTPKCLHNNFCETNNINNITAIGCYKTLFRFINKLSKINYNGDIKC